ncbi:Protein lozenge [Frankliniella fusca]|uniref:Protein lozenge n=1 Tax=Frankliniella fusca TaxID=407009 RepID=A0AAE1LKL2_9NEOP|nr:Protein lozenge [Frankliniella fusca]
MHAYRAIRAGFFYASQSVQHMAGQHHQFRAIALGQRPFLESPFTHLRELETFRRKSEYKSPTPSSTPHGL